VFDSHPGSGRRIVFLDVPDAWRADDLSRSLARIIPKGAGADTQLLAVGDWSSAQHDAAHLLASKGIRLIQRAPEPRDRGRKGVSLAVAIGLWLGSLAAGDVLDVIGEVADDPVFDSVGNLAAMRGVAFRRLSHRQV